MITLSYVCGRVRAQKSLSLLKAFQIQDLLVKSGYMSGIADLGVIG